jgi:hypothetical protein
MRSLTVGHVEQNSPSINAAQITPTSLGFWGAKWKAIIALQEATSGFARRVEVAVSLVRVPNHPQESEAWAGALMPSATPLSSHPVC